MKLNFLSGRKIEKDGYTNLDMQPFPGVDVVAKIDPFHPVLPFPDDSFEGIYANNAVEHIADTNGLIQEFWRVSQNGARWYLLTPGWRDPNSWNDPTHLSHWGSKVLDFYTPEGFDGRRYPPATLRYSMAGDDDHGLEFFVEVIKPGAP